MRSHQKNSKQNIRDLKKEMTWKNNLFARYMLLRYSLSLFFFANLYWFITLCYHFNFVIICPLVLSFIHIVGAAEQFGLYGKQTVSLDKTKLAFQVQAIFSILVILITVSPLFTLTFPIFAASILGRGFVIVLQVLGLLIIKFNLFRITQILDNKDKFYHRFQNQIEKYI